MAHIVRDSFDFYGANAEFNGLWDSTPPGSAGLSSTNTRFGAGQSFRPSNTLNVVSLSKTFSENATTVIMSFALGYYNALGAGTASQRFRLYDSGTVQCSFSFFEDGTITFYRGNAAVNLGTMSNAWTGAATTGAWTHLQIKVVLSNTVGSFEVRKNGNLAADYTLSGVDNCSTANEYANFWDVICLSSSSNSVYWDDLWFYSSTVAAGEPDDFQGDVRAVQIMPNSDSAVAFTRSAGATNFGVVDEAINASADFVSSATPGALDQYGNAGFVTAPASIKGVTVRAMAQKTDAGPRTASIRINSNGQVAESTAVAIPSSLGVLAFNKDFDPDGNVPWTAGKIAAMLFGPRVVT